MFGVRRSFSLRALLVLVSIVACACGIMSRRLHRYYRESAAIQAIRTAGGQVSVIRSPAPWWKIWQHSPGSAVSDVVLEEASAADLANVAYFP